MVVVVFGCPRSDEAAMFSAVKPGEPWSVEMVVVRRSSNGSVFDSSILHPNGVRTETCCLVKQNNKEF